jgi:hypothetical protein
VRAVARADRQPAVLTVRCVACKRSWDDPSSARGCSSRMTRPLKPCPTARVRGAGLRRGLKVVPQLGEPGARPRRAMSPPAESRAHGGGPRGLRCPPRGDELMVTACAVSHNWPCGQKCGVGRVASPVAAPGSDVPSCSFGRTAVGASAPRYQCPSQQRPLQDITGPVQKEETTPRGNPGPLLVAGASDACGEQPQIRVVWRPNPGVSTSTAGLTISWWAERSSVSPRWVTPR